MSVFGQPNAFDSGGLFSQSQPAQQSQPNQQSSHVFGQTFGGGGGGGAQQATMLGGSLMQPSQQGQQMPVLAQSTAQLSSSLWQPGQESSYQKPIVEQMKLVAEKWDPANPSCVFKHYFYNKVEEAHIPFYKPQPWEDPRAWEEALHKKPAPGFMPVLCCGYSGLADRLTTQKRAITDFNIRLHQINGSLDAITQRHVLDTDIRAANARRRQTAISERCLALAARVQILRNRGYALSGEEDDLGSRLQKLEREVRDPALGVREEELWSRLIVMKRYSDHLKQELDNSASGEGEGLDEETAAKARRVLENYEKQLQHLKREVDALGVDFEEWDTSRPGASRPR